MASENNGPRRDNNRILNTAVDLTIKIGLLLLIIFLCFRILTPFISILLWALVIAVILSPIYNRLVAWFGNRRKLSAVVIGIMGLAILLVPSYWLVDSLVIAIRELGDSMRAGSFDLPPPPESISEWPLIGGWLYDNWVELHDDLIESIRKYMPHLSNFGEKVLGYLAGTGLGILQFALSIIIAAVFLTYSNRAARGIERLFIKLAGESGPEYSKIAEQTMRNVAVGVIGVAIIQTSLFGTGMILAGLPLAGFWILITLILAIIQVPMFLVTIPMIIWSIATKDPFPAILWSVYFVLVGLVDNVLKPLIMGKGSTVPMLVIFLGALGGFIGYGFLGLFFGAFVISIGYKLYEAWLETD